MSNLRVLAPGIGVRAEHVELSATRGSGPGGQHRNTTDSAVLLRCPLWAVEGLDGAARERLRSLAGSRLTEADELLIRVEDSRSQAENRETAWARLAALLVQARRVPRVRRATKPTRGSVQRRLGEKRLHAERKARRRADDTNHDQ